MLNSLKNTLIEWNRATSERLKLQHGYLAIAIIMLIIAGLTSLVDYDAGQKLSQFAFAALVICVVNAVVWALLQSFVLARLVKPRQTPKRK